MLGASVAANLALLAIIWIQRQEVKKRNENTAAELLRDAISNVNLDSFDRIDHLPGEGSYGSPPEFRQLIASAGRRDKSFDRK